MAVYSPEIVPIQSGATLGSTPATTLKAEISGTLLRNGLPIAGAVAYAYYADEHVLIGSGVVGDDGKWLIKPLPTTAKYDIRFGGLDTTSDDWLYDIQAYVIEEQYDVTPPNQSVVSVVTLEE